MQGARVVDVQPDGDRRAHSLVVVGRSGAQMYIPWKALENGAALGMDDEGLLWRGGPWWVERIEGHGLGTALIEMGESVDERDLAEGAVKENCRFTVDALGGGSGQVVTARPELATLAVFGGEDFRVHQARAYTSFYLREPRWA